MCEQLGLKLSIAPSWRRRHAMVDQLRAKGVRESVSALNCAAAADRNAYLGALPIKAAFDHGADIVITGRCADSALALGILMHEFNWKANRLRPAGIRQPGRPSAGMWPAEHGGLFTDWRRADWHDIGYPIAECAATVPSC